VCLLLILDDELAPRTSLLGNATMLLLDRHLAFLAALCIGVQNVLGHKNGSSSTPISFAPSLYWY
jgi:hypothetical protein